MKRHGMTKPLKTNGGPYGSRTRLFRLKSRLQPNWFKGHSDSSCDVRGLVYQWLKPSVGMIDAIRAWLARRRIERLRDEAMKAVDVEDSKRASELFAEADRIERGFERRA